MPALGIAGQFRGQRRRLGRQGVDQRGLADAGLADQQGHAAAKLLRKLGNARRRSGSSPAMQLKRKLR